MTNNCYCNVLGRHLMSNVQYGFLNQSLLNKSVINMLIWSFKLMTNKFNFPNTPMTTFLKTALRKSTSFVGYLCHLTIHLSSIHFFFYRFLLCETSLGHIITTPDNLWHKQTSRVSQNTRRHRTTSWFFISSAPAEAKAPPLHAPHSAAIGWESLVFCNSCDPLRSSWRRTWTLRSVDELFVCVLYERGVRIPRDGLLASTVASKESGSFTGTFGKDPGYI